MAEVLLGMIWGVVAGASMMHIHMSANRADAVTADHVGTSAALLKESQDAAAIAGCWTASNASASLRALLRPWTHLTLFDKQFVVCVGRDDIATIMPQATFYQIQDNHKRVLRSDISDILSRAVPYIEAARVKRNVRHESDTVDIVLNNRGDRGAESVAARTQ